MNLKSWSFFLVASVALIRCTPTQPTCRSGGDCASTEVCLQTQVCAAQCEDDGQCPEGEKCSKGGGCVALADCGADADCKKDTICGKSSQRCQQKCQVIGCPQGDVCQESGHCTPPEVEEEAPDAGTKSCGGELFAATQVEANMFILLDRSGSMGEQINGVSKWSSASAAVTAVTAAHQSRIRFGLSLFPGSSACAPGTVLVPVGSGTAASIAASLPLTATGSATPIGAALKVAETLPELMDPNRANYALLITDGKENCNANPVQVVKDLFAKGIKTYVVGFGGQVYAAGLSQMAVEGGTARSGPVQYYQADDSAALLAAMSSVAQGAAGCDFKLAKQPPDPSKIFVYVNGQLIARDATRANGWEYTAGSERITLYGPACEALTQTPGGRVSLVYGCPDKTLVEGGGKGDGGYGGGNPDAGGITIN